MGKYDLWLQEEENYASLSHQPEYDAIFREVEQSLFAVGVTAGAPRVGRTGGRTEQAPVRRSRLHRISSSPRMGDKNQAFAWLEKGLKEKSDAFQYLKTQPHGGFFASDPRYADLLKRMGLPQ